MSSIDFDFDFDFVLRPRRGAAQGERSEPGVPCVAEGSALAALALRAPPGRRIPKSKSKSKSNPKSVPFTPHAAYRCP
jgi:hypothetical protein